MKHNLTQSEFYCYELTLRQCRADLLVKYKTQAKIAEVLGVEQSTLSKIFTGVSNCSSTLFYKILCKAGFVVNRVSYPLPEFND